MDLKNEIERLLELGYLRNYILRKDAPQQKQRGIRSRPHYSERSPNRRPEKIPRAAPALTLADENLEYHDQYDNAPQKGVICSVSGGPICGDNRNARESMARSIQRFNETIVNSVTKGSNIISFVFLGRKCLIVKKKNCSRLVPIRLYNFCCQCWMGVSNCTVD